MRWAACLAPLLPRIPAGIFVTFPSKSSSTSSSLASAFPAIPSSCKSSDKQNYRTKCLTSVWELGIIKHSQQDIIPQYLINGAVASPEEWLDALAANVIESRYANTPEKAHLWLYHTMQPYALMTHGRRIMLPFKEALDALALLRSKHPHLIIGL